MKRNLQYSKSSSEVGIALAGEILKIVVIAAVGLFCAMGVYRVDRKEGVLWLKVVNGALLFLVVSYTIRALP